MSRYYYCPECDVQLKDIELLDDCCPFCNTEIPEAAQKEGDDNKEGEDNE